MPSGTGRIMSELERWESRFAAPEYLFGTAPNAFLKSQAHRLEPGQKALALADGEGRNGVWVAELGLDVLSLDFSANALKKARALAALRRFDLRFQQVALATWPWPTAELDVIVAIFIQFADPPFVKEYSTASRWRSNRAACSSFRAIDPSSSTTAPAGLRRSKTCIRGLCWKIRSATSHPLKSMSTTAWSTRAADMPECRP